MSIRECISLARKIQCNIQVQRRAGRGKSHIQRINPFEQNSQELIFFHSSHIKLKKSYIKECMHSKLDLAREEFKLRQRVTLENVREKLLNYDVFEAFDQLQADCAIKTSEKGSKAFVDKLKQWLANNNRFQLLEIAVNRESQVKYKMSVPQVPDMRLDEFHEVVNEWYLSVEPVLLRINPIRKVDIYGEILILIMLLKDYCIVYKLNRLSWNQEKQYLILRIEGLLGNERYIYDAKWLILEIEQLLKELQDLEQVISSRREKKYLDEAIQMYHLQIDYLKYSRTAKSTATKLIITLEKYMKYPNEINAHLVKQIEKYRDELKATWELYCCDEANPEAHSLEREIEFLIQIENLNSQLPTTSDIESVKLQLENLRTQLVNYWSSLNSQHRRSISESDNQGLDMKNTPSFPSVNCSKCSSDKTTITCSTKANESLSSISRSLTPSRFSKKQYPRQYDNDDLIISLVNIFREYSIDNRDTVISLRRFLQFCNDYSVIDSSGCNIPTSTLIRLYQKYTASGKMNSFEFIQATEDLITHYTSKQFENSIRQDKLHIKVSTKRHEALPYTPGVAKYNLRSHKSPLLPPKSPQMRNLPKGRGRSPNTSAIQLSARLQLSTSASPK